VAAGKNIAVIGAGMAGIACARTLVQAGHRVTVFEKSPDFGGRMSTRSTAFGSFDHGAQYFTVRDPRFALALATTPKLCKPWSANAVRVLDALGRVAEASLPNPQQHWVPTPGMKTLVQQWAAPLVESQSARSAVYLETKVERIERDAMNPAQWQLRTSGEGESSHVYSGFDAVLVTIPSVQARALLQASKQATAMANKLKAVEIAPCWTLMVAFPNASQPGLAHLGPQWNAALSTHHRIAWLARESSKPGRQSVERWTVQASPAWSQEHLEDDPARIQAKLLKAFGEVTGIRAQPAHAEVHRWRYAKTFTALGKTHLWDAKSGIGVAGDWCIGHRVEDAFISGLELALAVVA
jgi:predicted NAD/FAD-dependent oxidoreductase